MQAAQKVNANARNPYKHEAFVEQPGFLQETWTAPRNPGNATEKHRMQYVNAVPDAGKNSVSHWFHMTQFMRKSVLAVEIES